MSSARLTFKFAVVAALMAALSTAIFAEDIRISVFVSTETDPSGLVDAGTKARQNAVVEIRKRLTSRKFIRLVNAREAAVIIVVVTSVTEEQVWRPTLYASPKVLARGAAASDVTYPMKVARATLNRGTFSTDFAEAAGAYRGSAQENVARAIDSWFHENEHVLRKP